MDVSRRDFLMYCGMSATALGLSKADLLALGSTIASDGAPAVLWLQGSSHKGDSISLLKRIFETVPKTIDKLLLGPLYLIFNPNAMEPAVITLSFGV